MDWVGRVGILDGNGSLTQQWPLVSIFEQPQDEDPLEAETVEALVRPPSKMQAPQEDPGAPFWVSVTKSGFRRLHRLEGCHVRASECFSWKSVQVLEKGVADKPCLLCWPEARKEAIDSSSDEESRTGSSSSSQSPGEDLEDLVGPVPEA